ncbi:GGDEF domain-containing protein [Idiomarina xiamenensis]|uniref:diguanylate cyclase n=1 Tax=Idiomarina xiamenensis 10-D-4 TaxID=740709 RepID=K2JHN3_9GAMM|nr:GGDEF domain-containing protein [Idiomarina xiamenensis]EKE82886.1 diguanylate cyclase [Idiomarina xiamenensis 10-D-4]
MLNISELILTLRDITSGSRHTHYFKQTRSHYIYRRSRLLAGLVALMMVLWIAIDALLLPREIWQHLSWARIGCGMLLASVALWPSSAYRLNSSRLRLLALLLLVSLFQTYSDLYLQQQGLVGEVAGYQFFPYMLVSLLAMFPLSIVEVTLTLLALLTIELLTQFGVGEIYSVHGINTLWLMTVLGAIAGWAASNQLAMLLTLYRQATHDPLTELCNRRELLEHMHSEIDHSHKNQSSLAILILDLDRFKQFNDNFGHAAGDLVLKQFASILKSHVDGERQLAGRIGGEEFLLMLPELTLLEVEIFAAKLLSACRDSRVRIPSGDDVAFTCSIGIAMLQTGQNSAEVMANADAALYQAKDNGRDQYWVYRELPVNTKNMKLA